jgi:hypothetical protein
MCLSLGLYASYPNDESQNLDSIRWKRGFIITLRGDTIHGKVKINDFLDGYYDFQRVVSFADSKGITPYRPDDLRSFSYLDGKSMVTMQSVSSPEGDGRVFLRLYYSGDCKVYGLVITEIKASNDVPAGGGLTHSSLFPTEKKYIQVGGSQFYKLKRIGFKKCMQAIFASCPHILSGLDSKVYTYDNLQDLIRDYNKGLK